MMQFIDVKSNCQSDHEGLQTVNCKTNTIHKLVVDVARDTQCSVCTRPQLVWKKKLQRIPAVDSFKPCSHSATLAVSSRKSFN